MKNKKVIVSLSLFSIVMLVMLTGVFYWKNLRGVGPVIKPPAGDIVKELEPGKNLTDLPLKLPDGFSISIFAKNLPGARVMEFDDFGNMWVSQTSEGQISLLYVKDGRVYEQGAVLKDLRKPHGLVFDKEFKTLLYFAEEDKISQLPTYSDGGPEKIADLPTKGGGHFTRTLGIGPDKRLYVSIGSSCNVCNEEDERRAKIYSLKGDGSDFKMFAKGLRNSVFFTWHPDTGKMWATEMGRDLLGDNIPPDEINIIEEGKNYGWPICYGKNIHDTDFDKNTYIRNPCMEPFETASHVDLQAHSAPLGLAFVPEWGEGSNKCVEGLEAACSGGFPDEYWNDLIVAYHGSWNRSEPTGYKLVRINFDENGNYIDTQDFITGWLKDTSSGKSALGRPVDVKFYNNALYISDDKAGVIYKIEYSGN